MVRKTICVLLFLFPFVAAHANCTVNNCSGVGNDSIKKIYPTEHSGGVIYLEAPDDGANLNCTLQAGKHMTLQSDHPLFNQIFATLLTARALGKSITVRIAEGSSNCRVVYVMTWI